MNHPFHIYVHPLPLRLQDHNTQIPRIRYSPLPPSLSLCSQSNPNPLLSFPCLLPLPWLFSLYFLSLHQISPAPLSHTGHSSSILHSLLLIPLIYLLILSRPLSLPSLYIYSSLLLLNPGSSSLIQ